ncbi:hypothetical protein [Winogradskyella sp. R77965]|uniref:hypothetical protein n=1 Tax=Winogradskyella sp. R77965 TaxID=3093872 RepID=UPI0037DC24E8
MDRKLILVVCLLFFYCTTKNKDFNKSQLKSNCAYLFFRGTETKQGYISKNYNLFHKGISHVGIGVSYDGEFYIHHIVNSDKSNHIEKSSLKFFYGNSEKINYKGIWKIKNINTEELTKLKKILNIFDNQSYKFDISFIGKKDNKLYCSELVIEVLRKLDSTKFIFNKNKKKLLGLHSTFLNRDTLEYFPADIFLRDENYTNIFEWYDDK